ALHHPDLHSFPTRRSSDLVKRMTATNSPTVYHTNHYFWHKTNQTLYFQNIQPMITIFTYISLVTSSSLISPTTKGPHSIFGRRSFRRQQHNSNRSIFVRIFESIQ